MPNFLLTKFSIFCC